MPGVDPGRSAPPSRNGVLTIKGQAAAETEKKDEHYFLRERRARRIPSLRRLPDTVDTERAESTYENGVLSITFPKQESKKARAFPST